MKKIIYSILIGFFVCSVSYAEMTDRACQRMYEHYQTAETEYQIAVADYEVAKLAKRGTFADYQILRNQTTEIEYYIAFADYQIARFEVRDAFADYQMFRAGLEACRIEPGFKNKTLNPLHNN